MTCHCPACERQRGRRPAPARGLLFRLFLALQNVGCRDVRPTDDWQGARFAWLGGQYEIRIVRVDDGG